MKKGYTSELEAIEGVINHNITTRFSITPRVKSKDIKMAIDTILDDNGRLILGKEVIIKTNLSDISILLYALYCDFEKHNVVYCKVLHNKEILIERKDIAWNILFSDYAPFFGYQVYANLISKVAYLEE